jgi:hypothetical protein
MVLFGTDADIDDFGGCAIRHGGAVHNAAETADVAQSECVENQEHERRRGSEGAPTGKGDFPS